MLSIEMDVFFVVRLYKTYCIFLVNLTKKRKKDQIIYFKYTFIYFFEDFLMVVIQIRYRISFTKMKNQAFKKSYFE